MTAGDLFFSTRGRIGRGAYRHRYGPDPTLKVFAGASLAGNPPVGSGYR